MSEPVGPLAAPVVILAADHRARGVITVEAYGPYLQSLSAALEFCDGVLATTQPLRDLRASGAVGARHRTYLSLNRTGLAGSAFELDDRLVASVEQATAEGWTGVKHMTRIDMTDPLTAPALELLGKVLESARSSGLEALVEPLSWSQGKVARDTDSIVFAAIVAHDLGAPVLKVPVPDVAPGGARIDAVARIVGSVGVPVLFLGGPRRAPGVGDAVAAGGGSAGGGSVGGGSVGGGSVGGGSAGGGSVGGGSVGGGSVGGGSVGGHESRELVLAEIRDAMAGGAAGLAVGRVVFQDPEPATMARLVAEAVRDGAGAVGTVST